MLLIALEIFFFGGGGDKKLKVFKFTVSNFQHLERPVLRNFKATLTKKDIAISSFQNPFYSFWKSSIINLNLHEASGFKF